VHAGIVAAVVPGLCENVQDAGVGGHETRDAKAGDVQIAGVHDPGESHIIVRLRRDLLRDSPKVCTSQLVQHVAAADRGCARREHYHHHQGKGVGHMEYIYAWRVSIAFRVYDNYRVRRSRHECARTRK
jgi:hypothetical protein